MTEVFVSSDNITSPVGNTTEENFDSLKNDITGIRLHDESSISEEPFFASLFNPSTLTTGGAYTKFDQLIISSVEDALRNSPIRPEDPATILILSTTKGNVSLLESGDGTDDRLSLHHSANLVAVYFGFVNQPIVVSNACISGSLALLTARRLITAGKYQHAVVTGGDLITRFILSGFQSFQAISPEPCKPFDENRRGINLGEGAATVILTSNKAWSSGISLDGGSTSNDANHISGPSRTGRELQLAISRTLKESGIGPDRVGMISAHGTATIFNDEMEAKAITLSGMQQVPVNSLKGYYGHTLGAAGIIESIISYRAMQDGLLLPTRGFSTKGAATNINVTTKSGHQKISHCLKTASGFGGCNAALLFTKQ
ncbi:MAG TPA: beta-ketoacyl synthase N-terminal-like domain-containing protein [Flavitalea sp.]|nr:beta-ketoacyl synthase N-terminal-like domain-containing protein [Flavitalea sp.]